MQIYFHSCLCSYLPRVPILVEDTVTIFTLNSIYDRGVQSPAAGQIRPVDEFQMAHSLSIEM